MDDVSNSPLALRGKQSRLVGTHVAAIQPMSSSSPPQRFILRSTVGLSGTSMNWHSLAMRYIMRDEFTVPRGLPSFSPQSWCATGDPEEPSPQKINGRRRFQRFRLG
ncbi:hypothetical protein EVAR_13872_1 [Eumeta japonica]|uniref:Uncharacterized protein n=1 Tax=Eumeta variegata TaxID=151549 RepID=A0A4C1U1H7_EUMVA|nr:hypothetical protein EVAR_13872_1 [Eumeta japonica]